MERINESSNILLSSHLEELYQKEINELSKEFGNKISGIRNNQSQFKIINDPKFRDLENQHQSIIDQFKGPQNELDKCEKLEIELIKCLNNNSLKANTNNNNNNSLLSSSICNVFKINLEKCLRDKN